MSRTQISRVFGVCLAVAVWPSVSWTVMFPCELICKRKQKYIFVKSMPGFCQRISFFIGPLVIWSNALSSNAFSLPDCQPCPGSDKRIILRVATLAAIIATNVSVCVCVSSSSSSCSSSCN